MMLVHLVRLILYLRNNNVYHVVIPGRVKMQNGFRKNTNRIVVHIEIVTEGKERTLEETSVKRKIAHHQV